MTNTPELLAADSSVGEGFAFFHWHSFHNLCDCESHTLDARLQWSWGADYR